MSASESELGTDPLERELAARLASYEEALAAGHVPPSEAADSAAIAVDARRRLERAQACLRLLKEVRPAQPQETAVSPAPDAVSGSRGPAHDAPGAPAPGTTISQYRLGPLLGGGGMGVVYKAQDTRMGRPVALKFLPAEYAQDRDRLERFHREVRTTSALNHPHICTVHDVGEYGGQPFLVMELVEGKTLRSFVGQPVAPATLAHWGGQAARALATAHAAGITHRDIKPENLMVRVDDYVKVLDFGLARRLPVTSSPSLRKDKSDEGEAPEPVPGTDPGILVGTTAYMSPEQARAEQVGNSSDVFSLGIVLYELATGVHPFQAASTVGVLHAIVNQDPVAPGRLNPELPAALEALLLRMLHKDARLRPTAVEVDAGLADLAGGSHKLRGPTPSVKRYTVGRQHELADLHAGFASARDGQGAVLCVAGEPGIGKTKLVEDFLAELAAGEDSCLIAQGRCSERLAGAEAYLPILEALESLLRGPGGDTAARLMRVIAPTWFLQVAPSAFEGSGLSRLRIETQAASQERMKRELLALLQDLSRVRPIVLFVDDLHWADASTIDLLSYLGGRCADLRLLVVLTYRQSELLLGKHPFVAVKLELQGKGACREIELGFLSRPDIERYFDLAFPGHRFPAEFAALVHGRTEGNPLFLVDLLRYLRDRGILAEVEGHWSLARPVPDLRRELPESVRSMIQKKLDRLGEEDRRLLTAASVQGNEFDAAVVAGALGRDATDVEERLDALDRIHLLVQAVREQEFPDRTLTLRYRFVHVLYQNALYAALQPARRASLSAAVAQALLARFGEKSGSAASELALLFEAARDFARAGDFFRLAAENAVGVFAHQEAILLARRGLELLQVLPDGPERARRELVLRLTLGLPLSATRGMAFSEVQDNYARALELCRQIGESALHFPAVWGLWNFYAFKGELLTARELAEQLVRLAEAAQDDALRAYACLAVGFILMNLGEFGLALEHLEKGIAFADLQPNPSHCLAYGYDARVTCRGIASAALWLVGRPDRALHLVTEALALARELAHPQTLAGALYFAAWVHQKRKEVAGVLEHGEALLALSAEHGFAMWLAFGVILRGWALAVQGRPREGTEQMRQGLAAYRATGAEVCRPHCLVLHLAVLVDQGQAEEGLALVADALASAASNGGNFDQAELHRLQGELLLRQKRTESALRADAERCFRQGLAVARRMGAKSLELRLAVSLSRLLQERGDKEEARSMLAEIYGQFTEGFDTADLQEARAQLAELT